MPDENLPEPEQEPVSGENPAVNEPDVDERGVPTKNVYAEMMRKMDQLERRTIAQAEERIRIAEAEAAQLRAQLAASQAPKPKEEEFTEEQLIQALAAAGDNPQLHAHIVDKLTNLRAQKVEQRLDQKYQAQQQQNAFTTAAGMRYPDLHQTNSPFYIAVAKNVEERIRLGTANARSVLDAAHEVAASQPELLSSSRPTPAPASPRGWGDRGSDSPRRQPKDTVKVEEPVFKDWAQRFPGLKVENIQKRQKDIQSRLIWNQGQG